VAVAAAAIATVAVAAALVIESRGPVAVSAQPSPSGSPLPSTQPMSAAGLLVARGGALSVTDEVGDVVPVEGAPEQVRTVSAGGGRILVSTTDGARSVADPSVGAAPRPWRALPVESIGAARAPGAIPVALSLDGSRVALVDGGPEVLSLQLRIFQVALGTTTAHRIQLSATGGVAWIDRATVGLEVLGNGQRSTIATVDVATGVATERRANGFSLSAAADGRRLAAIDVVSGLPGVHGADAWLNGVAADDLAVPLPIGALAERVALSPDGARLAMVVAGPDGTHTLIACGLEAGHWRQIKAFRLAGDAPVSIAWLQ
jgi:hypothetical protein